MTQILDVLLQWAEYQNWECLDSGSCSLPWFLWSICLIIEAVVQVHAIILQEVVDVFLLRSLLTAFFYWHLYVLECVDYVRSCLDCNIVFKLNIMPRYKIDSHNDWEKEMEEAQDAMCLSWIYSGGRLAVIIVNNDTIPRHKQRRIIRSKSHEAFIWSWCGTASQRILF